MCSFKIVTLYVLVQKHHFVLFVLKLMMSNFGMRLISASAVLYAGVYSMLKKHFMQK